MSTDDNSSTLYYDGACPLCTTEINHLRVRCGSDLKLVNVHDLDDGSIAQRALPSRRDLLLRLHLQTADQGLVSGLDANVAAWQHTPMGWLFRWLRWPGIKNVADRVYDVWARIRYRRRYET